MTAAANKTAAVYSAALVEIMRRANTKSVQASLSPEDVEDLEREGYEVKESGFNVQKNGMKRCIIKRSNKA